MSDFNIKCDKMEEYCGVLGIFSQNKTSLNNLFYAGLNALQHRGQEGAGISWVDDSILNHKKLGLAFNLFKDSIDYNSNIGIGHLRYSTNPCKSIDSLGPFATKDFAIAHNGHLTWEDDFTGSDTHRLLSIIKSHDSHSIVDKLLDICPNLKGSYSFTILTKDCLIGVRDPLGIRPLVLGLLHDNTWILASESCAIEAMNGRIIRMINPGEIIKIDHSGCHSFSLPLIQKPTICAFEYIYFSRADSIMDDCSIYDFRYNSGKSLAKSFNFDDADIVVATPDSGIPAAMGYAFESKLPYVDGFVKNHYVGRTFIEPSDNLRKKHLKLKLNVLKQNIVGKNIVLIDDSLVRGNTAKYMISELKNKGANKIYFLIASPPIHYPCFLGIDTKSHSELIAYDNSNEDIAHILNAEFVGFLNSTDLYNLTNSKTLCLNCFKEDDNYETIHNTNGCC